jgi:hypothetical protein
LVGDTSGTRDLEVISMPQLLRTHLVDRSGLVHRLTAWPAHVQQAYAHGQERPLKGYLAAAGTYAGLVATAAGVGRLCGARIPERIEGRDVALLGLATHKLSRMIAKDPVLSPLRAPFTTFEGTSGEAELSERVRGTGAKHAFGELITCPFCLAQWVATALTAGLVLAPRWTRLALSVLTAKAIADWTQFVYDATQRTSTAAPTAGDSAT